MGLVVLMNGNNVYTGIICEDRGWMKIYFHRQYLPFGFTLQLWTITGGNQRLADQLFADIA